MDTATRPAPPPSVAHRVVNDEPISPEEDLRRERERETNERYEYLDGWALAMHEPPYEETTMIGPTLEHSVLVAQDRPYVEQYVRHEEGSCIFTETDGLDATITLPPVDAELPLTEINLDVFDAGSDEEENAQRTTPNAQRPTHTPLRNPSERDGYRISGCGQPSLPTPPGAH